MMDSVYEYDVYEPVAEEEEQQKRHYKKDLAKVLDMATNQVKSCAWSYRQIAEEIGENTDNRKLPLKQWIAFIATTFAGLISTNHQASIWVQIFLYGLAFGIFFITDPAEIFQRWLALQTRIVVAIDSVLIYATVYNGVSKITILFLGWFIFSSFLCYHKNTRWLMGMGWLYKKDGIQVQRNQAEKSEGAWRGLGKKKTRSLLYEIGYEKINDDILDLFCKPIYILGHMHGLNKALEEQPVEVVEEIEIDEPDYEAEYEKMYEAYQETYKMHIEESRKNTMLSDQIKDMKEQIAGLEAEKQYLEEELEEANKKIEEMQESAIAPEENQPEKKEELCEEIEEEIPEEESDELTGNLMEDARKLKNQGYGVRPIADMLGVKKWKVEEALRKKKEEMVA